MHAGSNEELQETIVPLGGAGVVRRDVMLLYGFEVCAEGCVDGPKVGVHDLIVVGVQ